MGIRVIGQKKFEVTETELLQQDLLFYLDNPRYIRYCMKMDTIIRLRQKLKR